MKSSMNRLVDYRTAPLERTVIIPSPETYIQSQFRHITRQYKKTEPVTTIQKGDVVLLGLQSRMEKFNRSVLPLTVGSGLFDALFEEQLIGHTVGEEFSVTVQEETVKVSIRSATRTVFPEPTDSMAEAYGQTHEGWETVHTVEDFRSHVAEKYRDEVRQKAIYEAMDRIAEYVLTQSEWKLDEEELAEEIEKTRNEFSQGLAEEGKSLETMTAEELSTYFGIESPEELEEVLRQSVEQNLKQNLWLLAIHQKTSIEEIEGNPWSFLEQYVREQINFQEE